MQIHQKQKLKGLEKMTDNVKTPVNTEAKEKGFDSEQAYETEENNSFNFRIVIDFVVENEDAHALAYSDTVVKAVEFFARALSSKNITPVSRSILTSCFPFSDPSIEFEEHKARLE